MKKRPFALRDDFTGPELAVTKEQHDRMVEARGRNYTDDPIGVARGGDRRRPIPEDHGDNGNRIREDGRP